MISRKWSGVWVGAGFGTRAQSLTYGAGQYTGIFATLESIQVRFAADFCWEQWGLGVGITNSAAIFVVSNLWDLNSFHISEPMGTDVQVNLAGQFTHVAGMIKTTATALSSNTNRKSGIVGLGLANLLGMSEWSEVKKCVDLALQAGKLADMMKPSMRPKIALFDIPLGGVGVLTKIGVSYAVRGPAAVTLTGGW